MFTRRHILGSLAAATVLARPAFAGRGAVYAKAGYAIAGYDPVGYFRQSKPVSGSMQNRLMWRNAVWQFETEATLAAFERNPHGYAPRYGGFCALTLTSGNLTASDPEAWAIYEDNLYLIQSVAARHEWLRDPAGYIAQADRQWPQLCNS